MMPRAFVNGPLAEQPRQNLTLVSSLVLATRSSLGKWLTHDPQIAKMIQNMANRTCMDEPYMKALNPFVENNKARVNKFLNDLCEVEDLHDTPEVCNCVADSSPWR